jgi:hypothetical protein
MSLTSVLREPDVKARFGEVVRVPPFLEGGGRDVYVPGRAGREAIIGTAFDYLLRFYVHYINPFCIVRPWVAEGAMVIVKRARQRRGRGRRTSDWRGVEERVANSLGEAKEALTQYMVCGEVNREVLRASVLLAHLDRFARTRKVHQGFGGVDDADLDELHALYEIVPRKQFRACKLCVLNPTFGEGSRLVGGADADLLIDDTLMEIKATKNNYVDTGNVQQLVGYLVLMLIGGVDGVVGDPVVRRVGIYSARYGDLLSMRLEDIIARDDLSSIANWLRTRMFEESSAR